MTDDTIRRHPQISLAVYESDVPPPTGNAPSSGHVDMPNPTREQIESPAFQAIWKVIKTWDVNVPECYYGYCGANGSHVAMILNALRDAGMDLDEEAL